ISDTRFQPIFSPAEGLTSGLLSQPLSRRLARKSTGRFYRRSHSSYIYVGRLDGEGWLRINSEAPQLCRSELRAGARTSVAKWNEAGQVLCSPKFVFRKLI